MTNMAYALCNGHRNADGSKGKPTKTRYPLEMQIRALGQNKGGFVIGIFDCCREMLSESMRGGFGDPPDSNIDLDIDDYNQWIIWFGCPAASGVSANSTIAVDFFKELKKAARPYDGQVILPHDLMTWHPGDNGEMLQKYKFPLALVHSNWDSKGPKPADFGQNGDEPVAVVDPKALSQQLRVTMRALFKDARN